MKMNAVRFPNVPQLEDSAFWSRCSKRKGLLFLLAFLLSAGVALGALLAVWLDLFQDRSVLPLFFSGIPAPEQGFFSCFSTLLLNQLICLTVLFLLGVTAFGVFAVPLFVLLKGAALGLGVFSFLWTDGLPGLGRSALIYTPAAAASSLLFLLFAVRALVFSDHLMKVSFSPCEGRLDFNDYWKDYLRFLCFAVAISLVGSVLAVVCSVFLP